MQDGSYRPASGNPHQPPDNRFLISGHPQPDRMFRSGKRFALANRGRLALKVKPPWRGYIFITGGRGFLARKKVWLSAALGALLQARGYKVRPPQARPLSQSRPRNDVGRTSTAKVFVTDDGAETDLDLGHYERFTGRPATKADKHHHRTDLSGHPHQGTARRLSRRHDPGDPACHQRHQGFHPRQQMTIFDFVLCEIGGHRPATSRGLPFFEAIRQIKNDLPRDHGHLHSSGRCCRSSPARAN